MSSIVKRRDGFTGERLFAIPEKILKEAGEHHPELFPVYITYIGYFPKALHHYRERRKGCTDNILIYCLKGKGHYMLEDKIYEIHANQFILIPATEKHIRYWADKEDPWTIYWVHFTGKSINSFNQSLNICLTNGPVQIPFNDTAIEIWENICRTLEMGYSTDNLCSASFCLYHLIAILLFPQRHNENKTANEADFITRTIEDMRENLCRKLTVEDMAVKNSISVSHFSKIFAGKTGMSPMDYFIQLKMQKASQLLYASTDKIKSVAQTLGYDDPYYFSRLFKKHIGSSPEQYRILARNSG